MKGTLYAVKVVQVDMPAEDEESNPLFFFALKTEPSFVGYGRSV